MKSGNNGNQCVSVKKRLKIHILEILQNKNSCHINCLEGIPSSCGDVFVENSD